MRSHSTVLAAALLASALAACASPSHPGLTGSAADPAAPVPAVPAASLFDETPETGLTTPLPWAAVNRRVTPSPRGAAR